MASVPRALQGVTCVVPGTVPSAWPARRFLRASCRVLPPSPSGPDREFGEHGGFAVQATGLQRAGTLPDDHSQPRPQWESHLRWPVLCLFCATTLSLVPPGSGEVTVLSWVALCRPPCPCRWPRTGGGQPRARAVDVEIEAAMFSGVGTRPVGPELAVALAVEGRVSTGSLTLGC